MSKRLDDLVARTRGIVMTKKQEREQRCGFVHGNIAIENPDVTREMVDAIDDALEAHAAYPR